METAPGGIVYVFCPKEEKQKELIALLSGKKTDQGVCILDGMNSKEHLGEYRKKIDVIDRSKIVSTLTVQKYLIFYTMVTGIYGEETQRNITSMLKENGMEQEKNQVVNELKDLEKIKVRCIASRLKKIRCLVGKNLLDELNEEQRENLSFFLKKNFLQEQCLCLLVDSTQQENKEKEVSIP